MKCRYTGLTFLPKVHLRIVSLKTPLCEITFFSTETILNLYTIFQFPLLFVFKELLNSTPLYSIERLSTLLKSTELSNLFSYLLNSIPCSAVKLLYTTEVKPIDYRLQGSYLLYSPMRGKGTYKTPSSRIGLQAPISVYRYPIIKSIPQVRSRN